MQRTPAILTPRTAFFSRLLFFHRAGQTGCARQRQPYNNHARLTRIPAWSRKANTLAMTISTTPVANSRSNVSFFISRSPRTYHSLFLVLYSITVPDLPARDFPPRRSVIPFSFPLFFPVSKVNESSVYFAVTPCYALVSGRRPFYGCKSIWTVFGRNTPFPWADAKCPCRTTACDG